MKILYVAGMGDPLKDIYTGKLEDEITHSAQFFHPWYKLVKKGHQVDFVVVSNFNDEDNIKVDWFKKENIFANIYDPYSEIAWYRRIFRRIKRFTKLLYYTNKAIKLNKYDFIYCFSYYEGLAGNIVANWHGVPCGMRSMGTMLNEDLKKYGILGTALRRPIEYIMFKMKKNFFIMTDDGTKGDIVYQAWKPKKEKYDYYFWKTGIDLTPIEKIHSDIELPKHPYLFFAARFDNWKRHDKIIKILHNLHVKKHKIHLYFAGGVQSKSFFNEINQLVAEYGLEDYVHFLGAVKQAQVKLYAYHALANPLMYDVSNLGNVFFEIFSVGAIVVGKNDGSLNEYVKHNETGFLVENEKQATDIIVELIDDVQFKNKISKQAIAIAQQKFLSIDERFNKEVELIEKTIAQSKV